MIIKVFIILLLPVFVYGKMNVGIYNIPDVSYENEEIVDINILTFFHYIKISETNKIAINTSNMPTYIDTSLSKYVDANITWLDPTTLPPDAISKNKLDFLYQIKITSLAVDQNELVLVSTYKLYDSEGSVISSDIFESRIITSRSKSPAILFDSLLAELAYNITRSISALAINLDLNLDGNLILTTDGKNKLIFEFVKNELYMVSFNNGKKSVFEVLKSNSNGIELFDSETFFNKDDRAKLNHFKINDIVPASAEEIVNRKIQKSKDKNQTQQRKKMFGF